MGNGLLKIWACVPLEDGALFFSGGGLVSVDRKKRDRVSVDDIDDGLVGVGIWEARDLSESNHLCFVGELPGMDLTPVITAERGTWLLVVASKASRPLMVPLIDFIASRERRPRDRHPKDAWRVVGMLLVDLDVTFSSLGGHAVHPVLLDRGVTGSVSIFAVES